MQSCGLVVSIGVGLVLWWYTREAQKLRKLTEEQVALLKMQAERSVEPFASPPFRGFRNSSNGKTLCVLIDNPFSATALYVGVVVFVGGEWHFGTETVPAIPGSAAGLPIQPGTHYLITTQLWADPNRNAPANDQAKLEYPDQIP